MKRRLVFAAVVLLGATLPAWAFYGTRAVVFPPGTYLLSSIFDADYLPEESSQGVCSFWYNSTRPPADRTSSVILQGIYNGRIVFGLEIEEFHPAGSGSAYHLVLYLSDGTTPPRHLHWALFQSGKSLAFDGRWRNVAITWDTQTIDSKVGQFGAVASYGLLRQRGPPAVLLLQEASDGGDRGFETPYLGSLWTMGAELSLTNGHVQGFYNGALSQVFCHFGASDYLSIITSFGSPSTARVHNGVTEANEFGLFVPSEMGKKCDGVFGDPVPGTEDIRAAICMTGGITSFLDNQGGNTQFTLGARSPLPLQIAPTDPFGTISSPLVPRELVGGVER